jgi:membrane protein
LVLNLNQWARTNHLLRPLAHHWIFTVALPFILLWLVCAWIYDWVPNVKVQWTAALSGGLAAALLLEIGRHGLTWYAVNVVGRSHIYGALWVFPVVLLWFYVSWLIILFGAEVSFVVQNAGRK